VKRYGVCRADGVPARERDRDSHVGLSGPLRHHFVSRSQALLSERQSPELIGFIRIGAREIDDQLWAILFHDSGQVATEKSQGFLVPHAVLQTFVQVARWLGL
jgi:hypothetical protein